MTTSTSTGFPFSLRYVSIFQHSTEITGVRYRPEAADFISLLLILEIFKLGKALLLSLLMGTVDHLPENGRPCAVLFPYVKNKH